MSSLTRIIAQINSEPVLCGKFPLGVQTAIKLIQSNNKRVFPKSVFKYLIFFQDLQSNIIQSNQVMLKQTQNLTFLSKPINPLDVPISFKSEQKSEQNHVSLELHAGGEVRVGQSAGVLLDGDEVVEHLVALALLHDHLQRQLADRPVEHPRVQVPLLPLHLPPEGLVQVLQVVAALVGTQLHPLLHHALQDVRRLLVDALVALQRQFREELPQEKGGMVRAPPEIFGLGDASAFDPHLRDRGGVGLLNVLLLRKDAFVQVLIALEGQEGIWLAHSCLNQYKDLSKVF